jgi:hypothetical protein
VHHHNHVHAVQTREKSNAPSVIDELAAEKSSDERDPDNAVSPRDGSSTSPAHHHNHGHAAQSRINPRDVSLSDDVDDCQPADAKKKQKLPDEDVEREKIEPLPSEPNRSNPHTQPKRCLQHQRQQHSTPTTLMR